MSKNTVLAVMPFTKEQQEQMKETYPQLNFIFTDYKSVTEEEIKDAEVIIGNVPAAQLKNADKLQWIHLNSAGYDAYVGEGILPKKVILTNSTGAYDVAVGEHVLAMTMEVSKKLHFYRDSQLKCEWSDYGEVLPLHDRRVLIVGLGGIGGYYGKLMKALGNNIVGIRRNIKVKPDFVDEIYTFDMLDEQISLADIVVLALPASPQTNGLMNEERFKKMKKSAMFFNIGRGSLVDMEALYQALEQKQILGAGIDVMTPEPLPAEHPLWKLPNIVITPHISGQFHLPETLTRIQKLAMDNLEAFAGNAAYRNVVKR
ncbi:MAG: D-2-hydroxyacid dehydrogenase [Lachnospiraceae bacterium]|nr:D-2-hydroxyacid dehydrogenase [Lachnospiraceae bacterium]MDD3616976.1 D-2-hydroxyacid dehydrogenase [Lachnospiraceae bacterium]